MIEINPSATELWNIIRDRFPFFVMEIEEFNFQKSHYILLKENKFPICRTLVGKANGGGRCFLYYLDTPEGRMKAYARASSLVRKYRNYAHPILDGLIHQKNYK